MWDFETYKTDTAIIDENRMCLSYAQLIKECDKVYSAIGHRCLIFILCNNSIGSLLGYVTSINNRIVPVMLSGYLEKDLLDNLLSVYNPEYLWLPLSKKSLFPTKEIIYEAYEYVLIRNSYEKEYPLHEDLALLLTTSGSTGSPKFVRQSYDNIRANLDSIVEYLELDNTERPITTLPMNYTYGLSIINTHLDVGATILLTDKGIMQKEFWQFFKEQNATSFGGVPYTYEMLNRLRIERMDLPTLKTMTQAGGKLTTELHEKFARYAEDNGRRFIVMYGQCEATARMGYLPAEMAVKKKGSMGIAIPGGKFYLIDESGETIITPNTTGELVYEGANVTMGYAECGEDLKKGDERGGKLVTGDIAKFDEDGYYYIVGRKKRFLKIYGNRVNLDETDRLIMGKFGIEVACTGVDDHMCVFISDRKYSEEVKEYLVYCTKLNPAAFKVFVIDEIPKNDAGKTLYSELEKYYEQ